MNDLRKSRKNVLIVRILSIISLIIGVGTVFASSSFFSDGILPYWYHFVIFVLFFSGTFGLIKMSLLTKKK